MIGNINDGGADSFPVRFPSVPIEPASCDPSVELGLTSGGAIAPMIAVEGSSPSAICEAIGTSGAAFFFASLAVDTVCSFISAFLSAVVAGRSWAQTMHTAVARQRSARR
eukprot:CAMPEP_0180171234 /NCGR_PEP_ID=MMETSP0986-20121125/34296_1 /TAXON_ID=697907 /ORGANISM="non described non described, Strain CCMP2293" /LENGTH=109 /DNA_ID=CAMNT_0022123067 /DNA_START=211 /DNA_END=540 /DNA_ORIENTATION=-